MVKIKDDLDDIQLQKLGDMLKYAALFKQRMRMSDTSEKLKAEFSDHARSFIQNVVYALIEEEKRP